MNCSHCYNEGLSKPSVSTPISVHIKRLYRGSTALLGIGEPHSLTSSSALIKSDVRKQFKIQSCSGVKSRSERRFRTASANSGDFFCVRQ